MFSSEGDGKSPEISMADELSEAFSVSSQADAAQRSTMVASRQRVTL